MAEESGPSGAAEQLQNLHLDEATGEKVSKTELKRRQKQRVLEGKKQEKAAVAPPKPAAPNKSAVEEEEDLSPSVGIIYLPRQSQLTNGKTIAIL